MDVENKGSRAFLTFGVVHNQTISPTFNPRMFNVAIRGAQMFPKRVK
jgi:hypothetical protein